MRGLRPLNTHTLELLVYSVPTNFSRRCSRTTLTQHALVSSLPKADEIPTLVHFGHSFFPLLTCHTIQRRHAGCLCIFGWGHLHFWIMGIRRPRDDSVVSCDLYTLVVAPSWLLRHFFSSFMAGGGNTWSFGFFHQFLFAGQVSFFPGGFFPAISLGIWLIPPPSKYLYGFRWLQRIIFYFS